MRTAFVSILFAAAAAFAAPVPPEPNEAELREKALKLNKDITNEDTANTKLKELNKDKPGTAKLVKAAAKVLKEAKAGEKPFRFYAALVLAKAAHNAKEYDAAEPFYQYAADDAINDLKSGKLVALAGVSQIDFYLSRKQYAKAIKACDRLLEEDYEEVKDTVLFIMEKRLRAMARNGDGDTALEEINGLYKRARGNILVHSMKASLLRECGKLDESATMYKEGIEKVENDANMSDEEKKFFITSFRYSLSGVYTELDKIDDATAELEKLMKDNPDNPTFKNDLGFVWADNDKNLEKSEKLIREAIELDLKENKKLADEGKLDPELAKKANPAYVDSLGWVLYKNKKYDEAIKHLLQSAGSDDEESDHIEIWDHVGDCYLALGKKKEALEAFQRGLKSEDVTKKDAERRKKVTEKITKLKKELN